MAIYWPKSLPQFVNSENYNRKPQKQFVRSNMDAGPPKQRRRFSANKEDMDFSLFLTTKQVKTFENFYNDSLYGGAFRFEFPNPENPNNYITVRFRETYEINNAGYDMWEISMRIERMP